MFRRFWSARSSGRDTAQPGASDDADNAGDVPRAQTAHLVPINGADRYLANGDLSQGELRQDVVGVAVAWPKTVEIEALACPARERGVTALAVLYPNTDGARGQPGERVPGGEARARHDTRSVGSGEAISLYVSSLSAHHRPGDGDEIPRVHLGVASDNDEGVVSSAAARHRLAVSAGDCGPHALVARVPYHDHVARRPCFCARGVAAPIVDDDHLIDLGRHR